MQAASDTAAFIEGVSKEQFFADKRTQQAVVMNLIILGEASAKILERHTEFTNKFDETPWRDMRGMRNRMAHGYFDVDMNVVWDTVKAGLPSLLAQLIAIENITDTKD